MTLYRGRYTPQSATTRQPEYSLVITPAYKRTKKPRFIPARHCHDCGKLARSQYARYCQDCHAIRSGMTEKKKIETPKAGDVWGGVKILGRVRERVFLCECVHCGTVNERFLSWLYRYRTENNPPCATCRMGKKRSPKGACRICFDQPWRRAASGCRGCGKQYEEEEVEKCYDQRKTD